MIKLSEHLTKIQTFRKFLYEKPIFKVPLFLGIALLLFISFSIIFPETSQTFKLIKVIISFFVTIYLLFFVIHLIGKTLKSLINANNILVLLLSYATFMFCVLLFFSSLYDMTTNLNNGYLTYGTCSDKFNKSMIASDPQKSDDHFYFSAITLFTVGYGDICPMGFDKIIAIINAFTGVSINTILMVLIISNYIDRKRTK